MEGKDVGGKAARQRPKPFGAGAGQVGHDIPRQGAWTGGLAVPILDEAVSARKFAGAVSELRAAEPSYAGVWRLRNALYPNILIDVVGGSRTLFTLLFCMEDWNFLPPRATVLSGDIRRLLTPAEVPGAAEEQDGLLVRHVAHTGSRPGVWFCSPGFREYHDRYPVDRWERIRDGEGGRITQIVKRACDLIDRGGAR